MFDVSVILTAHREGVIAGATIRSALEAVEFAEVECGLQIEIIAILDKADELTTSVITEGLKGRAQVVKSNEGDPGQARNVGVQRASGRFVAFLDGDDLWSYNWLAEAWTCAAAQPSAIFHSECNITFGNERNVWWHVDSEGPLFDEKYLEWGNYWDALSFANRDIYQRIPFCKNDLQAGFGHEDWHWNYVTYLAGIAHKPVPGTMHFKRRRSGSQMSLVDRSGSVIWPVDRQGAALASPHLAVGLPLSGVEQVVRSLSAMPNLHRALPDRSTVSLPGSTIAFDPAFASMTVEAITQRKAALREESKVLLFVRNPLERATDELEERVFVKGGARGPISDAMLDELLSSGTVLSQAMSTMVENWKGVFGDRLMIVNVDEVSSQASQLLQSAASFLGLDYSAIQMAPWTTIYHEPLRPSLTISQRAAIASKIKDDIAQLTVILPEFGSAWLCEVENVLEQNSEVNRNEDGDVAFRKLLRWTESVGDNCEFGFVQRYQFYEPSSLFRWTVTPIDRLTAYLREPKSLFLRENLQQPTDSDLVLDTASGFYFHSELTVEDGETRRLLKAEEGADKIYKAELEKIDYLVSKFFNNLKSTPGIYIYKRNNPVTDDEFLALAHAIRAFNQGHVVLCVRAAEEVRLDMMSEGVFAGTICKFADYHTANIVDEQSWKQLLMKLLEIPDVNRMINKARR